MKKQLFTAAAALASVCAFADEAAPEEAKVEKAPAVSGGAGLAIANGQIWTAGSINADALVLQPQFFIDFDAFGVQPMEFWTWANYSTDRRDTDQQQKHCFTEIDLGVTAFFEFEDVCNVNVGLTSWQYPNRPWNGEELVELKIFRKFCEKAIEVGVVNEFMLTGDGDGEYHAYPYVQVGQAWDVDGFGEVGASVKGYVYYKHANHDTEEYGDGGFSTWSVKGKIALPAGFSVFCQYWGQIDDDMYTDETHDDMNFIYGAAYDVEF